MQILDIKIKGLYGFFNKKVVFNSKISILVGINGSGKTSVLNLINWLLKPSFSDLCLIEYDEIRLNFVYDGDNYVLISKQNEKEVTIDLKNTSQGIVYNQIQATFQIHPKKLAGDERLKMSLINAYDGLGPETHEIETWNFLFGKVPKPIVVGLDRDLYTEMGDELHVETEFHAEKRSKVKSSYGYNLKSPLDRVKSLLRREYNIYRNSILGLHRSLNEKIILSSFDDITTSSNITSILEQPKPSINSIELLEERITNFLVENPALGTGKSKGDKLNVTRKVRKYFKNLKKILDKASISKDDQVFDLVYITNFNQFTKINKLIQEFENFEISSQELYSTLKGFLDTMNGFFRDSSKELYFDKEKSELMYRVFDKKSKPTLSGLDIGNLSSGEKQVLILLTYLKYNSDLNVFIIDEPELSLHPKWQSDFLDAVDKMMPENSQLILATHSPELIGDKKEYCKVLLPYNS